MTASDQELLEAAKSARGNAYCRYSGFHVGAALIDDLGKMHIGCNVENAAYPEGTCAEANAIGAMIAAGGRTIVTIVVAGGRKDIEFCTPCGGCRQKIAEFANQDTRILIARNDDDVDTYSMDQLLPESFHL